MSNSASDFAAVLEPVYEVVPAGTLQQLKGDASSRAYFRFRVDPSAQVAGKPESVVIMHWPPIDAIGNSLDAQAEAFIDVRALLSEAGIDVPAILGVSREARLLALEDLGDETFEVRLARGSASDWHAAYARAIDLLAHLHTACAPPRPAELSIAYRKRLDAALLRWELDHFREWGIEALHGTLEPRARAELDRLFEELVRTITALPDGFVHRDYQSRNLMWVGERLVVIDFQDAFIGPAAYDLVALLCDSYVALDAEMQSRLLARYADQRGYAADQLEALRRGFDWITVQRKLKDVGRFVFIDRVRKNPDFLPYYPGSLTYVDRALTELAPHHPEARELALLLRHVLPGFPACPVPPALQAR